MSAWRSLVLDGTWLALSWSTRPRTSGKGADHGDGVRPWLREAALRPPRRRLPRRGRVPGRLVPGRVGAGLPSWPSRRIGAGPDHRPGPGRPRGHLPPDPRRRGRSADPGLPGPARHHPQLRAGQRLPVLRVRPGRRHPPHRRRRRSSPTATGGSTRSRRTTSSTPSCRSASWPTARTRRGRRHPRARRARRPTRPIRHPTYPESASRSGSVTKAEALARLTTSWNEALDALHPVVPPGRGHAAGALRPEDRQGRHRHDPRASTCPRACRRGCAASMPGPRAPGSTPS